MCRKFLAVVFCIPLCWNNQNYFDEKHPNYHEHNVKRTCVWCVCVCVCSEELGMQARKIIEKMMMMMMITLMSMLTLMMILMMMKSRKEE